ncbi:MAG: pentapeptide repeat-containing protein [bacterium]
MILRGVVLRGVILRGVILRGVILRGVILRGVILRGAILPKPNRERQAPRSMRGACAFVGAAGWLRARA